MRSESGCALTPRRMNGCRWLELPKRESISGEASRQPRLFICHSRRIPDRGCLYSPTPTAIRLRVAPLREMVHSLDPDEPVFNVRTMRDFYQVRAITNIRMVVEMVATNTGSSGSRLCTISRSG